MRRVQQGVQHWLLALGMLPLFFAGCDPDSDPAAWNPGPAFLIIGAAAEQPSSPDHAINVYIQARAGNYVGIVTHGGTHRYGDMPVPVRTSCAPISGSRPFYFLVEPEGDGEVAVEATLYSMCTALDTTNMSTTLSQCEHGGAPVTSAIVPIRTANNLDAAQDSADSTTTVRAGESDASATPEAGNTDLGANTNGDAAPGSLQGEPDAQP